MRYALILLSVLIILIYSGCSNNKEDFSKAEKLFLENCSACHGPDGKGKYYRGIPAAILTDKPVAEIVTQIRAGSEQHKKIKMRPMEHISDADATLIAEYLLKQKKNLMQ